MSTRVVRGKDFKFYRDTEAYDPTGYFTSSVWSLVKNIKDVTRNLETALADASVRGSTYKQQVGTMKDLSIDTQMVYDAYDDDLQAFENAFHLSENVPICVLDGDIETVGSRGIMLVAQVSKFQGNEALEDVGLVDITFVPGYDPVNLPTRVVVNSPGVLTPVAEA